MINIFAVGTKTAAMRMRCLAVCVALLAFTHAYDDHVADAEALVGDFQAQATASLTRDIEAFMAKDGVDIGEVAAVKPQKKADTGSPPRKKGGTKDQPRSLKELLVLAVQRGGGW